MTKLKRKRSRLGQVVVEMLLILPIFMTIVFTIMELGYLAFWMIMLNHATYEVARIGALVATPRNGGNPQPAKAQAEMNKFMARIIPTAWVESSPEQTLWDPQADVQNHELVVTGKYQVRLVFPISSMLLAKPKGSASRLLEAVVRMPIEQPLQRGESAKGLGGKGGGKFKKGG
ncbi:MAG: pilus assembly protein [Elusimicrobia bacterium]|nr:pilus assembly protein [Elusimicrobiota bacterium]